MDSHKSTHMDSPALPTWFNALLVQAREQWEIKPGRSARYADAGYQLGMHHEEYLEEHRELDDDEYAAAMDELDRVTDDSTARPWLEKHFSSFIRAVPPSKRWKFASGFADYMNSL